MRNQIITAVALMSVLNAGCFTVLGGVIGGISDGSPSKPAPRRPVEVDGPPGTPGYDFSKPAPAGREADTGMSGAGKGLLVGLAIDAVLIGAMAYALSQMDFGGWGCGDSGCSD